MADRPSDDGGGLPPLADVDSRPLCLICGEPALYDMSTLHRQPGAALWVCEEHVAHPDVIELQIALRELRQALRAELGPLSCPLEWLAAGITRLTIWWAEQVDRLAVWWASR